MAGRFEAARVKGERKKWPSPRMGVVAFQIYTMITPAILEIHATYCDFSLIFYDDTVRLLQKKLGIREHLRNRLARKLSRDPDRYRLTLDKNEVRQHFDDKRQPALATFPIFENGCSTNTLRRCVWPRPKPPDCARLLAGRLIFFPARLIFPA